jgi:hypothetical protein
MAILTNKPTSVSADSITSLELNKADLQTKLEALSAGAYWEDQSTWRGVAFLFQNSSKQKVVVSFDASGNTANLNVSEFFIDGDIECKRIDVFGFANDHYTIYREDFTSASEFDIEITDGFSSGGGGGPSSAIALYHFDGAGIDVYGNNLTEFGILTYNPGKFSSGVSDFSANLAYLKRDAGFLSGIGAGDFTIECWVKLENSVMQQDLICIFSDPSPGIVPTIRPFSLTYNSTNNTLAYFVNGSAVLFTDVSGKNDGNWHHVAIQRNSGVIRGFVDGSLASSAESIPDSIPSSGYELSIGFGGSSYPQRWEGGIDELRISNAAVYNIAGFTPSSVPLT